MTVNRQQFTDLLEPILDNVRNDDDFPRFERLGMRLYSNAKTSQKAKETIFERAGLGDFQEKAEGGPISLSDPIAGNTVVFTHIRRALRYAITQEMQDHDQYDEVIKLERDLQIAGDDDLEVRAFLLLNNGFGTTDSGSFKAAGFDSLALFSTAHTRLDGGATQRNRPSTDVNLSWTALADAWTQFMLWRDHRGRNVSGRPRMLWVHPNDALTARELTRSTQKPGTANNEINALMGELEPVVSPYITDTNSFYVQGAMPDTYWYWDVNPRTASLRDDEINEITGRKRVQGWSHGHGHWFDFYATSGVS